MNKKDHDYKLGISIGLSQASAFLMKQALNLFQKGERNDLDAKYLRGLSEQLAKMSDEERPPTPAFPKEAKS